MTVVSVCRRAVSASVFHRRSIGLPETGRIRMIEREHTEEPFRLLPPYVVEY